MKWFPIAFLTDSVCTLKLAKNQHVTAVPLQGGGLRIHPLNRLYKTTKKEWQADSLAFTGSERRRRVCVAVPWTGSLMGGALDDGPHKASARVAQ